MSASEPASIQVETPVVLPPKVGEHFTYDGRRFRVDVVEPTTISDSMRPWKQYAGWRITGSPVRQIP